MMGRIPCDVLRRSYLQKRSEQSRVSPIVLHSADSFFDLDFRTPNLRIKEPFPYVDISAIAQPSADVERIVFSGDRHILPYYLFFVCHVLTSE